MSRMEKMTRMGAKMAKAKMPDTISIEPVGIRVLVLPDPLDDDIQENGDELITEGGLAIPKQTEYAKDRMRERAKQSFGTLVAYGRLAWQDYDRFATKEEHVLWAKPGDRVSYAPHAGHFVIDPETGIEYVVMNDNDINSIIHSDKGNLDA